MGEALLTDLAAQPEDHIPDPASGTGEPALTLARRLQDQASILGMDAADGMVPVVRSKAARHGLPDIRSSPHAYPGNSLPHSTDCSTSIYNFI